jgi:hypothetical protein
VAGRIIASIAMLFLTLAFSGEAFADDPAVLVMRNGDRITIESNEYFIVDFEYISERAGTKLLWGIFERMTTSVEHRNKRQSDNPVIGKRFGFPAAIISPKGKKYTLTGGALAVNPYNYGPLKDTLALSFDDRPGFLSLLEKDCVYSDVCIVALFGVVKLIKIIPDRLYKEELWPVFSIESYALIERMSGYRFGAIAGLKDMVPKIPSILLKQY